MREQVVWILAALGAIEIACSVSQAAPETQGGGVPPGQVWLTPAEMREAGVEVAAAGQEVVDDTLVTTGVVALDETRSGHVFSPVTGRVTRILADLGQHVHRGDALAVIDSPDVATAISDARKAEADFIAAEHDLRRKRELLAEHAATVAQVEASQDSERNARAEFERARQKQRLLRATDEGSVAQAYTLRSPVDGEILLRNVYPGAEIQGQYSGAAGTSCLPGDAPCGELFTVGGLDRVWALGDLYEGDLGRVHLGARARVTSIAYPGQALEGAVDWISPVLDPATRTAKVRCTFDNRAARLRPLMYLNMSIAVDERRALAIPSSAVVRMGEYRVVFAQVTEGDGVTRFERVPVDLDETVSGAFVPVRHGIEEGQKIVVRGTVALTKRL